jgi:outer membrane protein assembly factor BamB
VSRVTLRLDRVGSVLGASLLAVILAACSGDVIGGFPSPPSPAITASPTPELQEGILAEIPLDGSPCAVAEAGGSVWITAFDGNQLFRVDPATNEVVDTYRMPGGPCGMSDHDGALWIETGGAGGLVSFDPVRGEVVDRLRIRGGVFGIIETPSGVWGVAGEDDQVVELDPDTMQIVGRVHVEGPLAGLAVQGDAIWTISGREDLVRIDPRSRRIAERIHLEDFEPEALAIDGDLLWVSSSFSGEVLRVDLGTGKVRDRLPVDGSLFGGVVIGGNYWVSGNDGTVYKLDASSGEVVDSFDLVGFGPFAAAGNLWTVDFVSGSVYRLDEAAD